MGRVAIVCPSYVLVSRWNFSTRNQKVSVLRQFFWFFVESFQRETKNGLAVVRLEVCEILLFLEFWEHYRCDFVVMDETLYSLAFVRSWFLVESLHRETKSSQIPV